LEWLRSQPILYLRQFDNNYCGFLANSSLRPIVDFFVAQKKPWRQDFSHIFVE
jgi:hypothetical protein